MIDFLTTHAETIGQGVLIVIGGLLTALGLQRGRGAASAAPAIEVMGDVVVIRKLDTMIEAIGQNSYHTTDLKKSVEALRQAIDEDREAHEDYRDALERNTRTAIAVAERAQAVAAEMNSMREDNRELRGEIKDLRDELRFGNRPR